MSSGFKPTLCSCGLLFSLKFHGLRYSYASLMIASGAHLKHI